MFLSKIYGLELMLLWTAPGSISISSIPECGFSPEIVNAVI
ncbi:MAG: hypothetical protein R6V01_06885 [Thermoplasmatota archaeon]